MSRSGQLREAQALSAEILETVADPVVAFDRQWRYTFVSGRAASALGKTPQEMIGRRMWDLFPEDEDTGFQPACERAWAEGRPITVERYSHVLEMWVESYIYPFENGAATQWRDITDRKRSEEALRTSEEQFRTLANGIPQLCWMANADGWIYWYNQRWYEYTGATPEQMEGWGWKSVHDPAALPDVMARWTASIATGRPFDMVFPLRRADGVFRPFLTRILPVRDGAGRVTRWFGTNTEIGDQLEAQERLRESEERYRGLFESMQEGFCLAELIYDEGGRPVDCRFLEANPAFETAFGRKREHVVGRTYSELFPGDGWDFWVAQFADVARTGQPARAESHSEDGKRHWEALAHCPRPGQFAVFFTDVTERWRAEQALAAAMQRLDAHMDNSPLAVIEFDREFRVTRWSKEAERVFGWRSEEVLGRTIGDMRWVHEDDVQAVKGISADMLTGKRPRSLQVNRNYRKDGAVIECEWYNSALYDSEGRLASVLSQVLDVSDRKRKDERLRQAQKMESIAVLAAGVAHDFNNLLVAVIGNASLAADMLPADSPLQELMDRIVKSGEQAAHLTKQMLAYSGKGRFVVEPLDLTELVREVTDLVRSTAPKKIAIELALAPELPQIDADRSQLYQVLLNLVINAAESIGDAAGLVSVETATRNLDAAAARELGAAPGRYVCLTVRDTGSGMDEATKARIFDPFFTTKLHGRGLGLAAVAGIVRGHNGAIRVESAPGRGTSFLTLFPARPARAGVATSVAPAPEIDIACAGTILVVDDEEQVRIMVQTALVHRGCRVLTAASGREGIDVLRRNAGAVSLAILDLSMPQMSGQDALPELLAIRPDLRVVISSGYAEAEALAAFEGMPVAGFLQKPYTARDLIEKVRAVLKA